MLMWLIPLVTLIALLLAIRAAVSSIQRESDTRYRRQEAWQAIYSIVRPRVPLPAPAPYQASPVLAAYCLEQAGRGRIISVDHEAVYCQATHDLLLRHGLQERVRVIHAPL